MSPTASPDGGRPFGELAPLLAPRSVAVVGASDRPGNLGGVAVGFLKKFGFQGPVWPVNPGRATVGELPCFPSLGELPGVPDLAVLAVPAEAVIGAVRDCIAAGVPAAVAWAGGFAEGGEEGRARQRELQAVCRDGGIKLCGPNCIGIINTSIGLTASFSWMMHELDRFIPGSVSIVSQSGGIAVMTHSRAQQVGFGFRFTISCGNEAVLTVPDFVRALAHDDGTRVIAVYTEGVADPVKFVDALAEARRCRKPVVILKGGAGEASGRAALAHTGRLAGVDRTYDAIFREFAAIRVYSAEELLDVCLQLSSLRPGQIPKGNRVVLTTFGGGSGVLGTDQCTREGLLVPAFGEETRRRVAPLLTPLASVLNPVDLTPQSINDAKYRAMLPDALRLLSDAPEVDMFLFLSAGMGRQAPETVGIVDQLRQHTGKPLCLSWLSPPAGTIEDLAARGIYAFNEHARAARAAGHLARYAADLAHRIRQVPDAFGPFPWADFAGATDERRVVSEDVVARILEAAGLPVARGRLAVTTEDAAAAAEAVGFPVVVKGISPAVTHRAAAGLLALNLESAEAVAKADRAFRARAAGMGVVLDGTWVQHMAEGGAELLVTAFRDQDFGVMVGCGMGGNQTEIIDDVTFTRAPIDADGALDLLARLRTLRRLPKTLSDAQRRLAAGFIARFSALAATAPWRAFTLELNPVKVGTADLAAVDGLLVIDDAGAPDTPYPEPAGPAPASASV